MNRNFHGRRSSAVRGAAWSVALWHSENERGDFLSRAGCVTARRGRWSCYARDSFVAAAHGRELAGGLARIIVAILATAGYGGLLGLTRSNWPAFRCRPR